MSGHRPCPNHIINTSSSNSVVTPAEKQSCMGHKWGGFAMSIGVGGDGNNYGGDGPN